MGDDLQAAELVRTGLCNAACLITTGRESTGCACACAGRWHGALADATVPDTAGATPTTRSQPRRDRTYPTNSRSRIPRERHPRHTTGRSPPRGPPRHLSIQGGP